jgi:hypothetical protein
MIRDEWQHVGRHLLDGFVKFFLAWIALAQASHELVDVGACVLHRHTLLVIVDYLIRSVGTIVQRPNLCNRGHFS